MPNRKLGEVKKRVLTYTLKMHKAKELVHQDTQKIKYLWVRKFKKRSESRVANRKRNNQLKIYLSDEEYQSFIKQVENSNLTQTDFFIRCVTKKKIIVIDGLKETLTELKRIGVNINQLSKNLNTGIFQNADKELKEIKQEFAKLTDYIIEILKGVK